MKIGFDFGMTNSTISFFDEENKLTNFKYAAGEFEYIPTVVSYNENNLTEVFIGKIAKVNLSAKNFDVYESFKLLLGNRFDEKIPGKKKKPKDVAKDYIKILLDSLEKSESKKIQSIVLTVPDTWIGEQSNQTARENLKSIFTSLGYDNEDKFKLVSEPIAAAAYFCYAHKVNKEMNPDGNEYNGYITIIDYGGGTLDVTLCKITNGENVKVLERHGFGEDNQSNGRAGLAFDEAVIEKLIVDNNLNIKKGSKKFIKLRNNFEEQKILLCEKITEQLKIYFSKGPAVLEGEPVFSLQLDEDEEGINVTCEDLVYCFDKINAPVLEDSLAKILKDYDIHNIDRTQKDNFKVLLVGGFSNFYAVEAKVREVFNSPTGTSDKRFKQPFRTIDRSFAISKGAALIAEKKITVEHTCPYDIGFIMPLPRGDDQYQDVDRPIIKKGTKLPYIKYNKNLARVCHPEAKLRIFMDYGKGKRLQRMMDESAGDWFPDYDGKDKEYYIGFSVGEDLIPIVHVKDKDEKYHAENSLIRLLQRTGIIQE
jgi:molecular chaperone DnaK